MRELSTIIVLDMQNDFLAPGGAFPKRHIETAQLTSSIGWLVQAARQQGRPLVWVTSLYGEAQGTPAQLAGRTHTGAACCVRGSWGAELVAELQPAIEAQTKSPQEAHFVKQWYSAFEGTGLHAWLQAREVKRLSLSGVETDVCVLQTAKEARQLGYEVEILSDVTTASTQGKHMVALREAAKLGVTARVWGELLSEGGPVVVTNIAEKSVLHCSSLRSCITAETFEALRQEVAWNTMSHRGGAVPRLIAIQGTKEEDGVEPLYRHPADEQPLLTRWTPTVDAIRREVEARVGHPLNHCLLQLYRNGRDWISDHADKTLDIARPSFIVNVSLGVTRTMIFRAKKPTTEAQGVAQKLPLPHGSLFMLDLTTNQRFYHGIKQLGPEGASRSGSTDEARISLTLRQIGTFYNPTTGAVWGVGSPSKTRADGEARAILLQGMSPEERLRKERGEAEKMLKLFRDENVEDTFEATSYQPGFEVLNFQSLLGK
jgi:nicotinamidase-related amidase/alkylated DNA repair dioxygenase AlkB